MQREASCSGFVSFSAAREKVQFCFMSMTWKRRRKDANAFCTCNFYALKCLDQQISIYQQPATDLLVIGTQPSFSLSCSEKVVKFEEAVLVIISVSRLLPGGNKEPEKKSWLQNGSCKL